MFILLPAIIHGLEKNLSLQVPFLATTGLLIFFGLLAISYGMTDMPFVRLAEKIFIALELSNPQHIDLCKSSKKQRTEEDAITVEKIRAGKAYGKDYFRY